MYNIYNVYTYSILYAKVVAMRTNIEIDDNLMADALKATGLNTKKEAVELGLKALIKLNKQASIRAFRGKLKWEGNLEEMRAK
jgi:Arc/MetJ family transcription regulator